MTAAKRKVSREEAWRVEQVRWARERRNWLHPRRPHLAKVLHRLYQHATGDAEMVQECYQEHRAWIVKFFEQERLHERDAKQNLPHLTLVRDE